MGVRLEFGVKVRLVSKKKLIKLAYFLFTLFTPCLFNCFIFKMSSILPKIRSPTVDTVSLPA